MVAKEIRKIVIAGAGGHGADVAWAFEELNRVTGASVVWEILGFVDDNPALRGSIAHGYPILGSAEDVAGQFDAAALYFHAAIGNNNSRGTVSAKLEGLGWRVASVVHPSAIIAKDVKLGDGCYLGPQAVIASFAKIGKHVIVNATAGIGHHVILGDFVQICPGARVSGNCIVSEFGFLGTNASVSPGVKIGAGAVVGANSFAVRDVDPLVTVLGVPARSISGPS